MEIINVNGKVYEVIDYNPYPHQKSLDSQIDLWEKEKKGSQFFVPVWHRRSGKSSFLVNRLFKSASTSKNQYYYFYPIQKKIREHIWDNPKIVPKYLPMSQVAKKDDQRMQVIFKSGGQVIFDGADDDPDKHRGGDGAGYVVDEYDDQSKRIFAEIIRPIIEFNKGWCVLGGTPRGLGNLHEGYKAGQDKDRPQWWSQILTAKEGINSKGERLFFDEQLQSIEKDYIADGIGGAFKQEYLCEFIQGEAQVFRRIDELVKDELGFLLKEIEPLPMHRYKMGCDPAITSDYWVNSVLDEHTHHEVYIERFQPNNTEFGITRTELLAMKYNNAEIVLDSSGIGKPIEDSMRARRLTVRAIKTGTIKEQLITNLAMIADKLTVRFLPDVIATEEMREFSFERLPSGRYRFQAPEGKHDDTVIARALSVWELGAPMPIPKDPSQWYPYERDNKGFERKISNTYFGKNKL